MCVFNSNFNSATPNTGGWKAGENSREWLLYVLPFFWIANLYVSSLPNLILGDKTIELGTHGPLFLLLVALLYAKANIDYCKGYMQSVEGRLPPFKTRTLCAKIFLYGAIVVIGLYAARRYGKVSGTYGPLVF